MSSDPVQPAVTVTTKTATKEETRTRRVPPYQVILENDPHHSFEFVVKTLTQALGYSTERSHQLMMEAHNSGQAVVWTGPREVAELKAEQIQTFHETRAWDGSKLGPLGCRIEPAPG